MEALNTVSKNYFEGKPPSHLKYLSVLLSEACRSNRLDRVYQVTLGSAGIQMPVQYRTAFVKYVINHVEHLGGNDDSDMLEIWYETLSQLAPLPPERFFRLYKFSDTLEIKLYENENTFVTQGTTGLMTWTASQHFVDWISTSGCRDLEDTHCVLELGAGTGLIGIAMIKLCPQIFQYVVTDGSAPALDNCRENFEVNCTQSELSRVSWETLDWNNTDKFKGLVAKERAAKTFGKGLLIGADIVFDVELIPGLVTLIGLFLDAFPQGQASGLLSCTVRNQDTVKVLRAQIEKTHLKSFQVHNWSDDLEENGMILKIVNS